MTRLASNSEIRLFKTCRRAWWLTYVRRLRRRRPTVVGAAPLGTRVHKALQAYYDHPGAQGRLDAHSVLKEMADFDAQSMPEDAEQVGKDSELARLMVEGYFEWLDETGADAKLEVIETERKVITRSPVEGVELIAKLDLSVRDTDTGDTGFLDHKTVQSIIEPIKILHLDEQFRQYALMHRLEAPDSLPRRFSKYNMLRKVKRTARATPPFYARYDVYISDVELRAFWNRLYGEINDMLRVERQLAEGAHHRVVAYPTPTRDCSWRCEYINVCAMFDDDASDPEHLIEQFFEPGNPLARYEEDAPVDTGVDTLV